MPAYVTKESILSGKVRTLEIKQYDQLEFDRLMHAYNEGKVASLEEAFPLLTPKGLEFLKYGTLPGEWDSNE